MTTQNWPKLNVNAVHWTTASLGSILNVQDVKMDFCHCVWQEINHILASVFRTGRTSQVSFNWGNICGRLAASQTDSQQKAVYNPYATHFLAFRTECFKFIPSLIHWFNFSSVSTNSKNYGGDTSYVFYVAYRVTGCVGGHVFMSWWVSWVHLVDSRMEICSFN